MTRSRKRIIQDLEKVRARLLDELRQVNAKMSEIRIARDPVTARDFVQALVAVFLVDGPATSMQLAVRVCDVHPEIAISTATSYISLMGKSGEIRRIAGKGVPGDPFILDLPEVTP